MKLLCSVRILDVMHVFMARFLAFLHQNTIFCRSDTDELRLSEPLFA